MSILNTISSVLLISELAISIISPLVLTICFFVSNFRFRSPIQINQNSKIYKKNPQILEIVNRNSTIQAAKLGLKKSQIHTPLNQLLLSIIYSSLIFAVSIFIALLPIHFLESSESALVSIFIFITTLLMILLCLYLNYYILINQNRSIEFYHLTKCLLIKFAELGNYHAVINAPINALEIHFKNLDDIYSYKKHPPAELPIQNSEDMNLFKPTISYKKIGLLNPYTKIKLINPKVSNKTQRELKLLNTMLDPSKHSSTTKFNPPTRRKKSLRQIIRLLKT